MVRILMSILQFTILCHINLQLLNLFGISLSTTIGRTRSMHVLHCFDSFTNSSSCCCVCVCKHAPAGLCVCATFTDVWDLESAS